MSKSQSSANGDMQIPVTLNEILQVRIPDDTNPVTYYSRVVGTGNDVLMIAWPTDRGIRLIARPGDVLEFYFIRDGIPHIFSGLVEAAKTSPVPEMTIAPQDFAPDTEKAKLPHQVHAPD